MTAGWYQDPTGAGQRYWDGQQWTVHAVPAVQTPQAVIVEGPNHVLHAILTFLTWPLCGGWGWVWLVVAAANNKRVRRV